MEEDAGTTGAEAFSPAALRVLRRIGGTQVVDALAALGGSDFASVMLEVVRRRAARENPAGVLRRYRSDRFVRPAGATWQSLRRAEDMLFGSLPDGVDVLTLAPVVPLGTHSVLGTVSQHKVVTAVRACEVAADPTNALTLEAADRRSRARDRTVRRAAVQRVVRAQQFASPGAFAHFSLFGMVTAGRDEGSYRFERSGVAEHVRWAASGLTAAGLRQVQVALTPLSEAGNRIAAEVTGELAAIPVEIVVDHQRQSGRGYYRDLCFKVNAQVDGEPEEGGDGGFTDWTMRLAASAKERLLISGIGVDRLAALADRQ